MKSLLEAGVHFGHQTRRWDPRMSRFIFSQRNGIHIIDLQKTIVEIKKAYEAVRKVVLEGKPVLFVGTKKQARAAIQKEAERCGQFYVNNRWLGGMLTNFSTIRKSVARLKKIEKMEVDGTFDSITKKEKLNLLKEKERLEKNLSGIKEMNTLPGILFVIDSKKEAIAVAEANKLKIPVVAVVDTNCNPDVIDYPIPGNDDAIRAINLFCSIIASACIDADNTANIFAEDDEEIDLNKNIMENAEIINKDEDEEGEKEGEKGEAKEAEETKLVKKSKNKEKDKPSKEQVKEEKVKEVEKKVKEDLEKKKNKDNNNENNNKGDKMNISADIVKKLRDITGAGMMECKKALVDANGNMDDAIRILKEKGLADAKKRADRETKEGGVFIKKSGNSVALIQLGCETDFVANSDIFKSVKEKILDKILESKSEDPSSYTDLVQEIISQTKENVELKVVKFIETKDSEYASTYIHGNSKIGVVAIFDIDKTELKTNKEFEDFALNIAMHIAASSPFYLTESEIPEKEKDEQKAIFMKQMEGTDKPANVIENIVKGKLSKYFAEICLLDQKYVKDDKITVSKYIEEFAKKVGAKIKIVKFYRYMIGA